jgi:hypothetical protein
LLHKEKLFPFPCVITAKAVISTTFAISFPPSQSGRTSGRQKKPQFSEYEVPNSKTQFEFNS